MNDLHEAYLQQGETIYAAKVDSVAVGPGDRRVKLELFIKAQRVEEILIYWNQKKDCQKCEVGNKTGKFDVLIENLEEDDYVFQIITKDKFGNPSLPVECVGKVLGENYKTGLVNRRITNIESLEGGGFRLHFAAAVETAIKSIVLLVNGENEKLTYEVPVGESMLEIPDCKEITYYTVYLPESNSPDVFDSSETTISLDKEEG